MDTINTYYEDYQSLQTFVNNHKTVLSAPNNQAVLVQIFCGVCDKYYMQAIAQQIIELIPHAEVVGTTTGGEIMDGIVSGLKTVLAFSVFQKSTVRTAMVEKKNINDYELGREIASKLYSDSGKVLILFATGLTVNASQLLLGVQSVNAGLPVAGGLAGDNFAHVQDLVLCNRDITDSGAVGIILESESLSVFCNSHLGWQPIGKEMIITRAQGSRIYTIDNQPAYHVYKQYLGIDKMDDLLNVIAFPLAFTWNNMEITRSPFFRYDDDSLGFLGDMYEGDKIRFSYGHVEMILEKIDTLLQAIRQHPVESIYVYSCAARRAFLQEAAQIETMPLNDIAPTAGFFTYGEFFHANNCNQLLNTTMTIVALSEDASDKAFMFDSGAAEIKYEAAANIDNAADRSIQILKALTRLVNQVTGELNEKTAELQAVNERLEYSSEHDALTGVYNRCFFEQETQRMGTGKAGIIMCDVDGLKFINDTCGHNQGDEILKATADILKVVFADLGMVARIGGDEFAILLPENSRININKYCRQLHKAVDKYNQNSAVPLSVSIGFSYREDETIEVDKLIKEADNQMYRQKLHRGQSTHSDLVQTLIRTLEERDIITEEHSNRLQDLLLKFALEAGIPPYSLADLRLLCRFHDVGKVGISDQILFKPGPLTPEEKEEMQRHCEIGYRIAKSSSDLLPVANWILRHHEWWNGEGYPLGLKGDAIPLECRILAIIDAYDAMTNDRPYRQAMSHDAAIKEIKHCAGTQFDPWLVDLFVTKMNKSQSKYR